MNRTIQEIPHYLSKKIADLAAIDPEIINLSIGEPYFKPPIQLEQRFATQVQLAIAQGRFSHQYAPSRGDESLRAAIAERYRRLYSIAPHPETEVVVTHGAAEAIWLSVLCLTEVGDEVIIPDPSYMLYETVVRLLQRIPVRIPTRVENQFVLDPADVSAAITPRTRLLFINSPENPTGAVYPADVFRQLGQLAAHHGFYLVHDEVYDSFVFQPPHYNLLREGEWPPYLVLINSFSKQYGMMGWRLGWMAGHESVINAAVKVHTNLTLNLGSFHQQVAGSLLNDPEISTELGQHSRQIEQQLRHLSESIAQHPGFRLPDCAPRGGFFLFPEITAYHQTLDPEYCRQFATPGEAVAAHLLTHAKIAVVPGYIYGPAGANHVRVVGAVSSEVVERACIAFEKQSLGVS